MPRLEPGQNAKIDNINRLVELARGNDKEVSKESLRHLLSLFNPMILKICDKWSIYFEDYDHIVKPWNILIGDAQCWFIWYTLHKYIPGGKATYNKFIKDHTSQRIRYIYECELNYMKHNMFPDPDKSSEVPEADRHDMLDQVIYQYGSTNVIYNSMDDDMINREEMNNKKHLVKVILSLIDDTRYFTQRESMIFKLSIIEGKTHDEIGVMLGISRPRVSQIFGKTKKTLINMIMDNEAYWEVY